MNNDNKVETAIAGLNCWASYATDYNQSNLFVRIVILSQIRFSKHSRVAIFK